MTPSWLGTPTQRIATIVVGGGCACSRVCACVMCIAIYDNNILTGLIMII